MSDFKVEWDKEAFKDFKLKTFEAVSLALKYTATALWGEVRKKAPTNHGRLAGSFELKQEDEFTWKIISNVKYALWVHEGTGIYGPHKTPIVPVRAKRLVFYWKKAGKMMYVPSVKGMEGRPYVDWAIEEVQPRIGEFAQRAIRETMEQ